jgi:hypothetical protein
MLIPLLPGRPRASMTPPGTKLALCSANLTTPQKFEVVPVANTLASMKAGDGVHFDETEQLPLELKTASGPV